MLALCASPAQAANECGELDPDNSRSIVCAAGDSAGDYDASEGNIFYEISDRDADYRFEVREGVVITGVRSNKSQALEEDNVGGEPQDDHGRRNYRPGGVLGDPKNPVEGDPPHALYGGIFIDTDEEFDGDIALESRADITVMNEPFSTDDPNLRGQRREGLHAVSVARGISVAHYGRSGDLDLRVGGSIRSPGTGVYAEIDSLHPDKEGSMFRDIDFVGDIAIDLLPGLKILTDGEDGHGVSAQNFGSGDITITARRARRSGGPDIRTMGHDASGFQVRLGNRHDVFENVEDRNINIDLENFHIKTEGGFGTDSGRDFGAPRDYSFEGSRGLKVYHFTKGAMNIALAGSKVETEGVRGQGIYAVYFADGRRMNQDGMLQNHGPLPKNTNGGGAINIDLADTQIMTRGNYADAVFGYHGSEGDIDIDVARGSEVTTEGANAHAVAGLHHGTGDVIVDVRSSRIATKGAGSDGIRGGHRGAGAVMITARNADIRTEGDKADGIFAFHLGAGGTVDLTKYDQAAPVSAARGTGPRELFDAAPAADFDSSAGPPRIRIEVDGGEIVAACAGEDAEDPADCRGRGIVAEFGPAAQDGEARVDIARAVVRGRRAVEFKGGRGVLNLADSRLVGNVLFADGDYDDVLSITQRSGSGRIGGSVNFLGGDNDKLTLDIADGQHFVFDGPVVGLESFSKTGGGWVRLADNADFANSSLMVDDGYLVVAGLLNAGSGELTVKNAGRLVFEAGLDGSPGTIRHGQIIAGRLRFEGVQGDGGPFVLFQLDEDLSEKQVAEARRLLAASNGLNLLYPVESVTDGAESELDDLEIRSRSDGGGESKVGMIAIDDDGIGKATFDQEAKDRIGRLDLPGTFVAGGGGGTGGSGGGGSGGGGGILGLGLLAVLLGAFLGGGEEADAGFAEYGLGFARPAHVAAADERGVLTLREAGGRPYRLWVRTGAGAQALPMAGVPGLGADGLEIGFSLRGGDGFRLSASAVPEAAARADALRLSAEGSALALSGGWSDGRRFAGLRLSQGAFEAASVVANPAAGGALLSRARLDGRQAQLRAGLHLDSERWRWTPSVAFRAGSFRQGAHTAQGAALRAEVPAFEQDYDSLQLGLRMAAKGWLDLAGGKWRPQLKLGTVRTSAGGARSAGLAQSDRLGVLSFTTRAGIRALPETVHSLSFGAQVKAGGGRAAWRFGLAGLEADGEKHYAALAGYRLRF